MVTVYTSAEYEAAKGELTLRGVSTRFRDTYRSTETEVDNYRVYSPVLASYVYQRLP